MKIIDADALFESLIFPTEQFKTAFRQVLDDEPAADLKKCFEGMTNGEVIQALFPNVKKYESTEYHNILFAPSCHLECCNEEWWSAPYQKGGE